MDWNFLWLGGSLVGLLWGFWSYVKMMLWRICNLMVVRIRAQGNCGQILARWAWQNLKTSPFGERTYSAGHEFVIPLDRQQVVPYEMMGNDFLVFWLGWRPLVMFIHVPAPNTGAEHCLTAMFLRGTFNADRLILEATDSINQEMHEGSKEEGRFRVERHFGRGSRGRIGVQENGDSPRSVSPSKSDRAFRQERRLLCFSEQELGTPRPDGDPMELLSLTAEVNAVLLKVERWVKSKKWYREKGIPWRLGLLLHGQPGTGKSTVARSLGQKFDLPINIFDLTSFSNEDFTQTWDRVLGSTPCIMLVEDIDASFEGRENRLGENGGGLTFDCLLNCISGVKDSSGVLLIITTNRPECLDSALCELSEDPGAISSRPGRIDYALRLGPLDEAGRRKLGTRILADCLHLLEEQVRLGDGETGAQFQNRCEQVALEEYWSEREIDEPLERINIHECAESSNERGLHRP